MMKRRLMVGMILFLACAASAPWGISADQESGGVPAFNPAPPPRGAKLAPILTKGELWGPNDQYPFQSHAYELATRIERVIYQQPCYCYCDRIGHKSLHSCFEDTHGAECSTCMKELYYAYQMSKQHRTAEQIRKGIIRGDWKNLDLQSAASMN